MKKLLNKDSTANVLQLQKLSSFSLRNILRQSNSIPILPDHVKKEVPGLKMPESEII